MDATDRQILDLLQQDATMPLAEIARKVGLSSTPCWRRIQKLEETKVIRKRVALLDGENINAGVNVFVSTDTEETVSFSIYDMALPDAIRAIGNAAGFAVERCSGPLGRTRRFAVGNGSQASPSSSPSRFA